MTFEMIHFLNVDCGTFCICLISVCVEEEARYWGVGAGRGWGQSHFLSQVISLASKCFFGRASVHSSIIRFIFFWFFTRFFNLKAFSEMNSPLVMNQHSSLKKAGRSAPDAVPGVLFLEGIRLPIGVLPSCCYDFSCRLSFLFHSNQFLLSPGRSFFQYFELREGEREREKKTNI